MHSAPYFASNSSEHAEMESASVNNSKSGCVLSKVAGIMGSVLLDSKVFLIAVALTARGTGDTIALQHMI